MKIQDIKRLFTELPNISQTELLDDLLQSQELKGTILLSAQEEVTEKRKQTMPSLPEQKSIQARQTKWCSNVSKH
jgi:hypothetical protein